MNTLDHEQMRAVTSASRFILVAAPPGSGKTRVLASRFARLTREGAAPESVLAVTFTNRAAREMRERIGLLAGLDPSLLDVGTFHAFCLRFLKAKDPDIRLIGRVEEAAILREFGVKNLDREMERISAYKNACLKGGGCPDVFSRYRARLEELHALDFDDLILNTIEAIRADDGAVKKSHVLIDEYQDINAAQAELVRLLAGGASLFAIGDPDQSIYSFRGALPERFLGFEKDFPGAETINLRRNYRSAGRIVAASNELIKNNVNRMDKSASHTREGGSIEVIECRDERAEAEFIIKKIESMMGGLSSLTVNDHGGARFSDFAVLIRTNRQAAALSDAFSRSSIPFHVAARPGTGLQDFIALLRIKTPPPGVALGRFIEEEGRAFGADSGTLDILMGEAARFEGAEAAVALGAFLDSALLIEPSDTIDVKADKVNILTLHAAKGLEFENVFIAGVEEGLLPLSFNGSKPDDARPDMEEERRLFYVGVTRARERVFLMYAGARKSWGEARMAAPSPFLEELPRGLLEKTVVERKEAKRRPVQKGLFE